jgi:hypothetical protein
MLPFLTYPLALFALASLPALTAIYILRNRFRRRPVSSLVLWRFRLQSREGGAKVHKLQLPLLFFLELIALLLLATAAAAPHWKLAQAARPLIVVLDDSISMRAVSANQSSQARARAFLEKTCRFQPPPSTRLIVAGAEPQLLGAPTRTWPEVEALLNQWRCLAPAASLDAAITLASEIGHREANILVLTDHAPPEEKFSTDRLQWRSFGIATDNLGIINASRTANGDQDRCLVEIANFSSATRSARIVVAAGTNAQETVLSLAPLDKQRLVFNIPDATPSITATLASDALAEDNQVQLLPPIRRRVRVQVALTNPALNELIDRTLAATGLRAAISDHPQLVIHSSDTSPSPDAWSLRWVVPEKPSAYSGPFIIDTSHPLAEGLALRGVVWAGTAATNVAGDLPVVLAGNIPLLSAREDFTGRQFLTLNLNPDLSTLPATPDWPVLFWNLLAWRAAQIPGLAESNARLGSEVILKTTGDPVTVTWPDHTVKTFTKTADRLALETPLPGIYSVSMGPFTNTFAVNTLAADESDLQACAAGTWGEWRIDAERRYEQSPMAWIFALGALAVLIAHLYLVASGKGGK